MKDPKRLASLAVSVTMGFALIGLAVQQSAYSWLLFLGVPFLTGFVAIMIYAWGERRRLGRCIGVSMIPLPVICGLVVAWKIDGLICCLMAAPIALPLAILGGYLAWLMQSHKTAVIGSCLILLVPPGIIFGHHGPNPRTFEVTTSITVSAPPEAVWRYVTGFPDIDGQPGPLFRAGIAYPLRSEIDRAGIGSARRCVLSTGTMDETVIAWNPPYLLRFRVNSTPTAMHELSPWRDIDPPHLHGFYVSKQGEFRLTELPGHRTLVAGTSWYSHGLEPAGYWRLWSDSVVHRIHRRVLEHIKALAEKEQAHAK